MTDVDERVARAAERWVGTPYRHQGSRLGVGCDCLGLLRGVWREVVGPEPALPPPYAMDWAERAEGEPMLDAMRRDLVPTEQMARGAVVAFRWSAGSAVKHCGVLVARDRMIHAYSGRGVVASPLVPAWRRRIAGLFRFPRTYSPE